MSKALERLGYVFLTIVILSLLVSALPFKPRGDIDGDNRYSIFDFLNLTVAYNISAENITAQFFYGNGTRLTGLCLADGTNCAGVSADLTDAFNADLSNRTLLNNTFNTGEKNWTTLQNYATACTSSQTITTLGDTVTCSSISITESQVSDLGHTVDTNETSRVTNLTSTDCSVGQLVIGVFDNGTVNCVNDADSGDLTPAFGADISNRTLLRTEIESNITDVQKFIPWVNNSQTISIKSGYPEFLNISQLLFVNGSLGSVGTRVGVNISTPANLFNVLGDGNFTGTLFANVLDLITELADAEISDTLTIDSTGAVTWSALTSYPSACSTGETITILGDTITCSSISITESQVSDLTHTVDTNVSSICANGEALLGEDTTFCIDFNVTVSDAPKNWTSLQNYPGACSADTFLTQVDDSITCTAISDVYLLNDGDTGTGGYIFSGVVNFTSTVNFTGPVYIADNLNVTLNITLGDGGFLHSNGTCLIMSSPNGLSTISICD